MDVGTFFHIFCGVDFEINTVKETKNWANEKKELVQTAWLSSRSWNKE